jgi:hypothetical protein
VLLNRTHWLRDGACCDPTTGLASTTQNPRWQFRNYLGETVFRRRPLPAAGALVAGDPPAAPSAAPPTMVSHTFTLRPHTPPAPCSNLSLLFVLPLSLSRARSQFSIAAINESDSGGQWEPLAPTKEAQVGILLLPSLLSLRTCHRPKILVVCFFSFWMGIS